jgi:hypothetical protein
MYFIHVGFEVLAVAIVKSSPFQDITPCTLVKVMEHIGATYHFPVLFIAY